MLLMVQKEAADRICAPARSKDRYPLGITIQAMGEARIIRKVPPQAFFPSPEVTSALLEVSIDKNHQLPGVKAWRSLLRTAFSKRRKTLLNNLDGLLPGMKWEIAGRMEQAGLSVSARAEELEVDQWQVLFEMLRPSLQ
jgi:16S rRNA (adenine1518-N6/adenine1519-N6)-dimethyltransferase